MNTAQFDLTPAELKAIEEHKYYLSQRCGGEVSIQEAIEDFLLNYASDWRCAKLRQDNETQWHEIEIHKYLRSEAEGRDIGATTAAVEWCQKYAHIWRKERESLEQNGFMRRTLILRNAGCLHMQPSSEVAMLARQFDCDVYVHKEGMKYYNFLIEGRPYLNLRSMLGFLPLGITVGDRLEFIATGKEAVQALNALELLLTEDFREDGVVSA
jgi:phosphotransferase system HPr (HPr) family protein